MGARTLGPARPPHVAKAAAGPSYRFKGPAAPSKGARAPTAGATAAPAPGTGGAPGATVAVGTAAGQVAGTGASPGASPTPATATAVAATRRAAPVRSAGGSGTAGTVSGTLGATPAARTSPASAATEAAPLAAVRGAARPGGRVVAGLDVGERTCPGVRRAITPMNPLCSGRGTAATAPAACGAKAPNVLAIVPAQAPAGLVTGFMRTRIRMILNLVLVVKEVLIAAPLGACETDGATVPTAEGAAAGGRFSGVGAPRARPSVGDLPGARRLHPRGVAPPRLPPISPVAPQAEARPLEVVATEAARRVRVGAEGAVAVLPDAGPGVPPPVAAPRPSLASFRAAHVVRIHLPWLMLKRTGFLYQEELRYLRRP